DLDAHRVRRPALDRRGEGSLVRVALELVHAPDEARAVVAAARGDAEVDLGAVARAAPDVRHPDLRERDREDLALPVVELRERKGRREARALGDLPAVGEEAEVEDLRGRVRGLGAGRLVLRP